MINQSKVSANNAYISVKYIGVINGVIQNEFKVLIASDDVEGGVRVTSEIIPIFCKGTTKAQAKEIASLCSEWFKACNLTSSYQDIYMDRVQMFKIQARLK